MSKFRTIKVSDPRFERDHLRHITVKTPNLKGRGDLTIFVPPATKSVTDIPLVILLHGVYGSHWAWTGVAGVHITALRLMEQGTLPPLVLAMPSDGLWGDGSGYLPHDGYDFEKWITHDTIEVCREVVPAVTDRSPLFLTGLSMGGFGALRLGAKSGNLFSAISGHSSITATKELQLFVEEPPEAYNQTNSEEESVLQTILNHRDQLPSIRFDCGTEDLLIEPNRILHTQLVKHNIQHRYEEYPGGHEWPYWEEHIVDTLLFFGAQIPHTSSSK